MEIKDIPKLLTVKEVMSILKIGRCAVYQEIEKGRLNAVLFGGKYRILEESVMALVDQDMQRLSVPEVVQLLGVSKKTIYAEIKAGRLDAVYLANRYHISADSILALFPPGKYNEEVHVCSSDE